MARLLLALAALALAAPAWADLDEAFPRLRRSVMLVGAHQGGDQWSTGTAFVVARRGGQAVLATNHHVIQGAAQIVVLPEGADTPVPATVLGDDPVADLALLSAAVSAPALELESSPVREAQRIAVVGYPLMDQLAAENMGIQASVTEGIVSAVRQRNQIPVLQVDAALNPGNSGGPAFHWKTTRVVGVAVSRIEGAEGMNFLIGLDALRSLMAAHDLQPATAMRPTSADPVRPRAVRTPAPAPPRKRGFPGQVVLGLLVLGLVGLGAIAVLATRGPAREPEDERPTL